MRCTEAQDWIRCERRFADGLPAPDQTALEEHLAQCTACQTYRERERVFDAAVRPVLLDVEVPVALPERIQWALRRDRRTRQRTWSLYAAAAAAAVLLIALSIGWYVNRPYNLVALHAATEWLESDQVVARYSGPPGAEGLNAWLRQNHVPFDAPVLLHTQYLANAYLVKFDGRTVPLLELREGNALSRVYLLERRYFKEAQQLKLFTQQNVKSYVIADEDESPGLGLMIVDQGNPQQFVNGVLPRNKW